jgi:hypothetical protein
MPARTRRIGSRQEVGALDARRAHRSKAPEGEEREYEGPSRHVLDRVDAGSNAQAPVGELDDTRASIRAAQGSPVPPGWHHDAESTERDSSWRTNPKRRPGGVRGPTGAISIERHQPVDAGRRLAGSCHGLVETDPRSDTRRRRGRDGRDRRHRCDQDAAYHSISLRRRCSERSGSHVDHAAASACLKKSLTMRTASSGHSMRSAWPMWGNSCVVMFSFIAAICRAPSPDGASSGGQRMS